MLAFVLSSSLAINGERYALLERAGRLLDGYPAFVAESAKRRAEYEELKKKYEAWEERRRRKP